MTTSSRLRNTTMALKSPEDYRDLELSLKASNFLRENRPEQWAAMKRDGTLQQTVKSRVEACKAYAASLIDGGMFEGEAWNMAIRKELLESESD